MRRHTYVTIASTSWGVLVATFPAHVGKIEDALRDRGVDHFVPRIETLLISNGRHVREARPLLGEYVPFAVTGIWRQLLGIKCVQGILLNTLNFPAQVLPSEMDRLRGMCSPDGMYRSASAPEAGGFEYGQRVSPKSADHFFSCQVGRYDGKVGKKGRGDAALFLLFGRDTRVVFNRGDLVAV